MTAKKRKEGGKERRRDSAKSADGREHRSGTFFGTIVSASVHGRSLLNMNVQVDRATGLAVNVAHGRAARVPRSRESVVARDHWRGGSQLRHYLKQAKLNLGLLINFNVRWLKDGIHRIVNNLPE